MDTPVELPSAEYQEPRAPYDDFALGVECAWPCLDIDLPAEAQSPS